MPPYLCVALAAAVACAALPLAAAGPECPCDDPTMCYPITTPLGARPEVVGWSVNASNYRNYDYTNLTTLALFFPADDFDPQIVCHAHKFGTRVVWAAKLSVSQLGNDSAVQNWVDDVIAQVTTTFTDGVNIDIEQAIAKGSPEVQLLPKACAAVTAGLKAVTPHYQTSFDVAWSPDCIDGRCYDVAGLAAAVDFLAVMAYDEQSQQFTRACTAGPNSGLDRTKAGLAKYLDSVKASQLVLGTPWYGYSYQCQPLFSNGTCAIASVPFRGVPCSDAAGRPMGFADMEATLSASGATLQWDAAAQSPFFNVASGGNVTQYWFDDVRSLTAKYSLAADLGLLGVAVWNIDAVRYGNPQPASTAAMWRALHL